MIYLSKETPARRVTLLGNVILSLGGIRSPGVKFDTGAWVEVMLSAEFHARFDPEATAPLRGR